MKPEKGFYYHYKHDSSVDVGNYAYEILNIAHHTEIDDLDEAAMVVYAPIYASTVYKAGRHWDVRPIKMFMENVTKDGKTFPRFAKITDPKIIAELERIKKELYS